MNPPQVYMCSPSWTLLPPPSPYHPSGSSQCTSPKHPVSCIEPGLATRFIHDIIYVSMPFSQIFPPSPSPTESIRLFCSKLVLKLTYKERQRNSDSINNFEKNNKTVASTLFNFQPVIQNRSFFWCVCVCDQLVLYCCWVGCDHTLFSTVVISISCCIDLVDFFILDNPVAESLAMAYTAWLLQSWRPHIRYCKADKLR